MTVENGIIRNTALNSLEQLSDSKLKDCLRNPIKNLRCFDVAEKCLRSLRQSSTRGTELIGFFNSWRATHFTADVTAGIADSFQAQNLAGVATAIRRISDEDRGHFGGDDHGELFNRLASWACDSEHWKDSNKQFSSTKEFSRWLASSNSGVSSSPKSLAAVLGFELLHRGECELAAEVFGGIASEEFGLSQEQADQICEYPRVHGLSAAEENKENLLYAEEALKSFYEARGEQIDTEQVKECVVDFFNQLEAVFSEANQRLAH